MKRLIVLLLLLTPWIHSMEPEEMSKEVPAETLEKLLEGGGRWINLVEEILPGYSSRETGFPPSSRISQLIARKILPKGPPIREFILSHVSLPFKHCVGHTETICPARLNPAGDKVVTDFNDNTVRIWDAATGRLLHTLGGHSARVSSAVFNTTGDKVATASFDTTAKIWKTANGQLLHTLKGHTYWVFSAVFNTAGDKVVTGSCDNTAKIWNTANGSPLRTLTGHNGFISSAEFSTRGDKVVTASDDGTAIIWDAETGRLLHTLRGHTKAVFEAVFNPTDDKVVTASKDGTAIIWDAETGRLLHTLRGHTEAVYRAVFNLTDDKVVTASDDGTAIIWNAETGRLLLTLNKAMTISAHKTARMWDLEPLLSSEKFLTEDITLQQVAILNDIFELAYVKNLQKQAFERGASNLNPEGITFDFNKYPHLWEEYNALPEAIKGVFNRYITALSPREPEQAPRGWCWPF